MKCSSLKSYQVRIVYSGGGGGNQTSEGLMPLKPMCQTQGPQARSGPRHNPVQPTKVFYVLPYIPQHALQRKVHSDSPTQTTVYGTVVTP